MKPSPAQARELTGLTIMTPETSNRDFIGN